jgi:hypothetical protein
MPRNIDTLTTRRRPRGFFSRVLHLSGRAAQGAARLALSDTQVIVLHARLILGVLVTMLGLLSFASDRYCDGNVSSYYACTRPSTYYYYPWWAVVLVLLGVLLIMLWYLRRK